jgi:hypothetical protein
MSKLWGRRPSPSLVISILALFVALGGSAYAASKIGTKNIKKNAITASKIKKNAVTTTKIKNNAVTGTKINEGTLGAVPSAAHASTADSATKATDATNAVNAVNFSRFFSTGLIKASGGQTVQLLSIGPFTITGKCADLGGGKFEATSYITTSQAHSNVNSEGSELSEANFEPGEEFEVGEVATSTGPFEANYGYGGYYSGFVAMSGDGRTLLSGEVTNSVNISGANCAFWAFAVNAG